MVRAVDRCTSEIVHGKELPSALVSGPSWSLSCQAERLRMRCDLKLGNRNLKWSQPSQEQVRPRAVGATGDKHVPPSQATCVKCRNKFGQVVKAAFDQQVHNDTLPRW